jgi:hypothetical protein
MPVSETLGEFSLVCGQCDTEFTGRVAVYNTGQKVTACPACGRTCRVYGVDQP